MMFKKHLHDLSHYKIMPATAGPIFPTAVVECLPEDSVQGKHEAIVRLSPMKHPTMTPLKIKTVTVFCPTRLVWPDWEKFITQGAYGSTPPVHPFITVSAADTLPGTLLSSMGVKTPGAGTRNINAIPISCHNLICNTLFRDEDLGTERDRSDISGDRTGLEDISHFYANWPEDYFTNARPWAQKSVSVPIPQSNVVGNGEDITVTNPTLATDRNLLSQNASGNVLYSGAADGGSDQLKFGSETGLEMDDSAKMRDLSLSGALQLFFENRAEDGSRLIEYLRRAFGSNIKDSVLQQPQVINYSEKTIQFSEVVQTGVDASSPLGSLAGHGVGGMGTNSYHYKFGEHGYLFSYTYIMPEAIYDGAMERFWFKNQFYEYFQNEFEAVGQQPIWAGELIKGLNDTDSKATWGWQKRYGDYMRALNQVSGTFEGGYADQDWTMSRIFASPPTLNEAFLTAAPTNRIFSGATPPDYPYQLMIFNKLIFRRNVKRHVKKRIL